MPSDHPPTSTARVEYAERIRDGKQEVWKPDGKGWRVIPTRSVERDIEKLGLRADS
jgi:hypothetical protein